MLVQGLRLFVYISCILLGSCFQKCALKAFKCVRFPLTQYNPSSRVISTVHASKRGDPVTIVKDSPSACQFIAANYNAFKTNLAMRKLYGIPSDTVSAQQFYAELPIIYLAGQHKEYGTIGYLLNKQLGGITMKDVHPELRYLRSQPVYAGGPDGSGSSFTMLHQKAGFPDNRPWKTMSNKPDFKLFYSPDVAMANELCSTNNALPSDFRFFQWSCVWLPGQLEEEHRKGFWTTFDGPIEMLFPKDRDSQQALFQQVKTSLCASISSGHT